MALDASPTRIWLLRKRAASRSCHVRLVPGGIEVEIFSGKALLVSRICATEREAFAWAEEEREDLIGRGWTETGAIPEADVLTVSIGADEEASRECCLCARWFTGRAVQCTASVRFVDADAPIFLGMVCDDCVDAGSEGIRQRILANAAVTSEEDRDEEFAEHLRRLAEAEIVLPSPDALRMMRRRESPGDPM